MGLRGDFDELKQFWFNCSPPSKLIFGASFLLSTLSIASLSDAVFKFRGFLATTIEFYDQIINYIAGSLSKIIYFDISFDLANAIILLTALTASKMRANYSVSSKYFSLVDILAWVVFIVLIIYFNPTISSTSIVLGYYFSFIFFVLMSWFRKKKSPRDISNKFACLNFLAVILFIAICSAISDGLTRNS